MERYELKVKYEQIKSLMAQEQYQEAMDVCNTIDWDKSKNINMLCAAGEVYERCGLFEDSKAIYLRAYQLQPQSRIVIYRLAELSIKLRDQEDSIHFYKLYEDAAPYDVNLFVLRYKIYRAKGASIDVLISILEELKENDYHERWAYELAKLYSVAGMIDKCVAECDEIDLWFGDGRYVRQALQLKRRYQALTPAQKQKLEVSDPKPHKAEETIRRRAEAEKKQQETQAAYDNIKAQGADKAEEADRARRQAIDAAREARAAQLLAEAAEEGAMEDAAHAEKDGAEFYGQGTWPQLHISRPEEIKAPVLTPPVIERPQRSAAVGRPVQVNADDAVATEESDTASVPTQPVQEMQEMTEAQQAANAKPTRRMEPIHSPEMTENDILAANIARILEGKSPRQITPEEPYEDDYISTASEEVYAKEDNVGREDSAGVSSNIKEEKSAAKNTEALKAKKPEKKVQPEEDDFVDDYEMENPPEEDTDTTEEDDAAFARRESAFHRMWRMTSNVVSRKPKGTTVIAKEQEYDIQIKPVVVSRYDTLNLQKELAKSIRAIMNATEKSEVEKTMEDMDRSMEESNIPKLIQTKRLNIQEVKDALQQEAEKTEKQEAAAEQEATEETLAQEAEALDSRMQEMLGEEYDGQLRMVLEQKKVEKQITGQMSFGDVFVNEQQRSLVAAKKKALAQTEAYIDQLAVVMPYIGEREEVPVEDETNNNKEALQKAQEIMHEAKVEERADIEQMIARLSNLLAQTDGGAAEAAAAIEPESEEAAEEAVEVDEAAIEEAVEIDETAIEEEAEEAVEVDEAAIEEAAEEAVEVDEAAIEEAVEIDETAIEEAVEVDEAAIEETVEETVAAEVDESAIEETDEAAAETEAAEAAIEETAEEAAAETEAGETAIGQAAEVETAETEEAEVWQDRLLSKPLSKEEQQKILSYFMKFDGIEGQIISFMEREKDNGENFVVMGAEGSGRMSLALRLMKVIIKSTPGVPKRIAKMSALALNEKPVNAIFAKIGAGTLIVEHAESLQQDACTELLSVMDAYAHAVRVILIGETEPMEAMFAENPSLETYFTYCFHLHNYSNNELVEFAKAYAETQGYSIDELAVLALYTRLASAKTNKQAVMLGDVKEIVNDAIKKSRSTKGLRHVFDNLMMKNVDDDGNLLLRERDFEMKA